MENGGFCLKKSLLSLFCYSFCVIIINCNNINILINKKEV
nr:MAG TPA: Mature oligodendrocyte transmembrane protein [Caudoviricetes sp.]